MDPRLAEAGASKEEERRSFRVSLEDQDLRLDVFLHQRLRGNSRSFVKSLIRAGKVAVDGQPRRPAYRVRNGEKVLATISPPPPRGLLVPEEIPFSILHEDACLLVVDKPAGLVVHPGNGCRRGTLANGLAWRFHEGLSDAGGSERPGIVHRLDRDTSGVMVVAKTNRAHFELALQFQQRTTKKEYLAIVEGEVSFDADRIDVPVGRSRHDPSRMTVDPQRGKAAATRYQVLERFRGATCLRCYPETGRTHQIRVHLRHLGHPVMCDALYGRRGKVSPLDLAGQQQAGQDQEPLLARQALHARRLGFRHPLDGKWQEYTAPVPSDMSHLLDALRRLRPVEGHHA